MSNSIQLLQISPEELKMLILKDIKKELETLKKDFQPKVPDVYMTRSEVANYLKINLSTVHSWSKSGKLKSYGIGNRVYYKRKEVENSIVRIN